MVWLHGVDIWYTLSEIAKFVAVSVRELQTAFEESEIDLKWIGHPAEACVMFEAAFVVILSRAQDPQAMVLECWRRAPEVRERWDLDLLQQLAQLVKPGLDLIEAKQICDFLCEMNKFTVWKLHTSWTLDFID